MKITSTGSIYTAWAVSVVPFWESLWPYLDDDDNNDRLGGNGLLVYVGDDLTIAVAFRHYGMGPSEVDCPGSALNRGDCSTEYGPSTTQNTIGFYGVQPRITYS